MQRLPYPPDLSDAEWHRLAPLLPPAKSGGRPRTQHMREICHAIYYLLAAGCSWRMLPHDLPAHQTVYGYVHAWSQNGTWERINTALRRQVRVAAGRDPEPRAARACLTIGTQFADFRGSPAGLVIWVPSC